VLSPRPDADPAGNLVVAPPGDLDYSTATALVEALHEALSQRPKTIILDLGLVTSLDRSPDRGGFGLRGGCRWVGDLLEIDG